MLGANSLQRKITNSIVACVATIAITAACLPVGMAQATPAQLKDSSNVSIEQAAQRLVELSSQSESAALDLGSIDEQIATTKLQIDETQQLLESTHQDLESAKKALTATVSETYRNGSVSYLEVLLGSTSFDDFSSRLSMLDRVAYNRASAIETVEADIMPLDGLIAFAESPAGAQVFGGEEAAKGVAQHGRDLKAAGKLYCDCPACAACEAILGKKDQMI